MTLEETVAGLIERSTAEARADERMQGLLSGQMEREELRTFFRNFLLTHLNSVHILSFLLSLAPRDGAELVRENLLEEMGLEEAEKSHPEMLIDLAQGLGFSDQEIAGLRSQADEAKRAFASSPLPFPSLREMGMSILMETVAFEHFLSRVSDRVADSLIGHYTIPPEAVRWFTLHGEVDVRHAEEGRRTIARFISFYRFHPQEVERIAHATFGRNVILSRYFPAGSAGAHHVGRARIQTLDLLPLAIPFTQVFQHAKSARESSNAVVVRLQGSDGTRGYGEALPRPYVTGEDVASMLHVLQSTLGPNVLNVELDAGMAAIEQIRALVEKLASSLPATSDVTAWNASLCAVELALLDWAFGRAGLSISEWLAPARWEVVYSGVIDAADPEVAANMAARYRAARIDHLKVKVGLGDDLRRLEAVRKAAGDGVGLRVDANGAWDGPSAIAALKLLGPLGVQAVEQPVAAHDLAGLRLVREQSGIPVIADESLVTLRDAQRLIESHACDMFNVRVSKCGGLLASKAIAELGLDAGMKIVVGAQVGETSLLSAAGRHLAAHLRAVEFVEGSFGTHLLSEDVTSEPVMFGYEGRADVLSGPGLGVGVDNERLERLASEIIGLRT